MYFINLARYTVIGLGFYTSNNPSLNSNEKKRASVYWWFLYWVGRFVATLLD